MNDTINSNYALTSDEEVAISLLTEVCAHFRRAAYHNSVTSWEGHFSLVTLRAERRAAWQLLADVSPAIVVGNRPPDAWNQKWNQDVVEACRPWLDDFNYWFPIVNDRAIPAKSASRLRADRWR